ncbi:putative Poxvirus D5 protein [Monocercomonoides exilis]|uniref:putative Poxvirus D5 protein n=1 Tax=Monocercomonoides exilis TaxID=2049356 RepID=UPI00355A6206|nr:putative Poxvirus D5 protein [Monocercomonoides exilis]|eukprot:MONOS_15183.1-p1 / transcript=MONOS_15183.1 / gene=MONOS_15183 / organism=Monocercomonoides_exilis_PA203 / gene_product=Poxvirus D5 protein / transcript_product=Poxvirus D5 protein / location=Mono_scaffold01164:1742-2251(+) / protein_length=169 / sequence_SO=supercontig / SO=protein_coding / is_pseudo=false
MANEQNNEIIKPFLDFTREVIVNDNDELYQYILCWISSIIQNPGEKTKTSLVLKGLQGIGKNVWTNELAELLAGYSCPNVIEIAELTGQFNSIVEVKMLIVLNELKNVGDDRTANFDALKKIITDSTIRINEKNQPRRTAENVANFIFVTNYTYPVKIEIGDRRYVVCD